MMLGKRRVSSFGEGESSKRGTLARKDLLAIRLPTGNAVVMSWMRAMGICARSCGNCKCTWNFVRFLVEIKIAPSLRVHCLMRGKI